MCANSCVEEVLAVFHTVNAVFEAAKIWGPSQCMPFALFIPVVSTLRLRRFETIV